MDELVLFEDIFGPKRNSKRRETKMENEKETVPCRICGTNTPMTGTKLCDRCWELERRISHDPKIAEGILLSIKIDKKGVDEGTYNQRIAKAALIISQRVMDEWYGSEQYPEDCQLFEETLCHLLQENPEECEELIGTVFCEEEEIE